jgi:trans-2,3-dihydro-3-hydroxyanthranilate isomerase
MRNYRYLHLDVFTDRPFEGNQLAVFPEPQGLSADEMQRITKEMNFSECTFIFPAEAAGTNVRMRIFTPGEELPMAGHPTIGSTYALIHEGVIPTGTPGFVFGLGVGPTPVSIDWRGDTPDFVWMTQQNPTFGASVGDRAGFAAAIGLDAADLEPDAPIESISCGVPFLFARLRTREAVDRVTVDRRAFARVCAGAGVTELPLFVFTTEAAERREEAVYSRMLAPGLGVSEDPATGSASGPLGCYLSAHGGVAPEQLSHFVSLQGAAMGRPSRIHISINRGAAGVTGVRVGGRSVLVGHGELRW